MQNHATQNKPSPVLKKKLINSEKPKNKLLKYKDKIMSIAEVQVSGLARKNSIKANIMRRRSASAMEVPHSNSRQSIKVNSELDSLGNDENSDQEKKKHNIEKRISADMPKKRNRPISMFGTTSIKIFDGNMIF